MDFGQDNTYPVEDIYHHPHHDRSLSLPVVMIHSTSSSSSSSQQQEQIIAPSVSSTSTQNNKKTIPATMYDYYNVQCSRIMTRLLEIQSALSVGGGDEHEGGEKGGWEEDSANLLSSWSSYSFDK